MTAAKCADCGRGGKTRDIEWYSVDLDIPAVPLCRLCWMALTLRSDDPMVDVLRGATLVGEA